MITGADVASVGSMDLNPARTTEGGRAPCPERRDSSSHLASEHADNPDEEAQDRATTGERWARIWPSLLAVVTLSAVGGPAAVASYRHARDVIAEHGDPVMAPWLALTTDGMLLAALIVIWVRRHRNERVRTGPWAAFWAGMAATMAANLAAARPTPVGLIVALWPPVCLAITLELVALVATQAKPHPSHTDTPAAPITADAPVDPQPAPGHVPAPTAHEHPTSELGEAGHDTGTKNRHQAAQIYTEGVPEIRRSSALVPDTNGHTPVHVPTMPTPHLQDPSDSDRRAPEPASEHRGGMEPGHKAGQNGHHSPAPTRHAPDGDILAWLRQQAHETGHVPGRRKVIAEWALGSTRADRLRWTVIDESAHHHGLLADQSMSSTQDRHHQPADNTRASRPARS